ncbi:hypothetical protein Q9L58_002599 [Maublancomyces gigas]|uniref:Phosphatidate phosphatase APP1 catalytic domain-containing protein n=1 Tax=Discina gigas TaxID=1032678 RepID=A0ABR3GQT8_9PEZI
MQTSGDAGNGWGSYYRQLTGTTAAGADPSDDGRQPGGRRQKIAGFLKSANELRQIYYQGYTNKSAEVEKEFDDYTGDQPTNSWPEVEVMRSGDEELVLFPSYARRRPDKRARNLNASGGNGRASGRWGEEENGQGRDTAGRGDFLNDEYSSAEEDDNVVDVDVRGWLYAPHSGPLTRKNRYLHWVALKLCGLPAQTLSQPGEPDRNPTAAEAESTKETAAAIVNNGQPLSSSTLDEKLDELTRAKSAAQVPPTPVLSRRLSWMPSVVASPNTQYLLPPSTQQQQQQQQQQPQPQQPQQPQLSAAEVASAHSALTARLAPFMHRPIPGTPLTVFFFNSKSSQSRTLYTSDTGHFALRIALPFLPTHVRVLASETLSTTEPVIVHEPRGISLISDIDDTVKHSAVSMGAREIFRNTFTAPLSTLRIPGVADWYGRLAAAPYNVNFHYVSNSPWQLYPILKSFFEEAGLPPGSMHLKQYSGMLQGIFEPVAERKRGTVEKVIKDFPERLWVLVGDSGEADLEVYTEIVEKFPGRILAVFIRDVTTTPPPSNDQGFFDSNESKVEYMKTARERADAGPTSTKEAETEKTPPPVPPKRRSGNTARQQQYEEEPTEQRTEAGSLEPPVPLAVRKKTPPPPRPKPAALQGLSRTNTLTPIPSAPLSAMNLRYPPPSSTPPPLPRRTTVSGGAPLDGAASTSTLSTFAPLQPPSPTPSLPAQVQQEVLLSKREELWIRRWERALVIMGRSGVALYSWRNGGDAEGICRKVVEDTLWGK